MKASRSFASVFFVLCLAVSTSWAQQDPRDRAKEMLAKMTLEEKGVMVRGVFGQYTGNVEPIERLGIPSLKYLDGPQGVRTRYAFGTSTLWPSAMTVAASFDTVLMYAFAAALGQEFYGKGAHVALATAVNLARVPVGGRNFEYMAGEDPFLGVQMAAANVRGIQDQGVMSNVKHYALNNQEVYRQTISAEADERTIHELYYPAFESTIKAGVYTVMCAYNKVNGTPACESDKLMNVDLKEKMGFEGFVMSDWTATRSDVESALGGMDQEMPYSRFFGNITGLVEAGLVPLGRLDDMVLRILTAMYSIGIFDRPATGDIMANVTSVEHNRLARRAAAESTVLLKNDGNLLPLDPSVYRNIAVLGSGAQDRPVIKGGGSGGVVPPYIITPLHGISIRANASTVTYAPTENLEEAVQLAADADVAIVFLGTSGREGTDRDTLEMPEDEVALLNEVAAVQPNVVAVVSCPGAAALSWSDRVPAILVPFMPGQEAGNAIADVLFGDVNPAARLPVTFPNYDNEIGFTEQQYPGLDGRAIYSEKLLVGYRWYDAMSVQPRFPFGHGLSYTSFTYASLSISPSSPPTISFYVQNRGGVLGSEVAQLYLGFPSSAGEPPKQLKGFYKVHDLAPGIQTQVIFQLTERDVSIYDVTKGAWTIARGTFTVYVGASSRDIRLTGSFTM